MRRPARSRAARRARCSWAAAALRAPALRAAARIAAATGCALIHETFAARIERGAGLPAAERLPYFPEQGAERLRSLAHLVLAGAREPVAFFGYPDHPSRLAAERHARVRCSPTTREDVTGALEALALRVKAPARVSVRDTRARRICRPGRSRRARSGRRSRRSSPRARSWSTKARRAASPTSRCRAGAPAHDYLALTGGAIGQGLPAAVGAALACPDRKVIAFQADGSGMYTLQSLWTCARESLDVIVVVAANRAYRILQVELARAGIAEPGAQARALTDLSHPALDWVSLARGMGVPGSRADTAEEFIAAFRARARRAGAAADRGGARLASPAFRPRVPPRPRRSARTGAAAGPSGGRPPNAAGRRPGRPRAPCGCSRDRPRSAARSRPTPRARACAGQAGPTPIISSATPERNTSSSCHGR